MLYVERVGCVGSRGGARCAWGRGVRCVVRLRRRCDGERSLCCSPLLRQRRVLAVSEDSISERQSSAHHAETTLTLCHTLPGEC